jgi:hypothetical protein
MAFTEKGRWANSKIDERGKIIINSLTENGKFVFDITGVPANPSNPPVVTIISVDHYRISKQSGIDHSVLVFSFDTDVTSWTVNVLGTDPTSGTVVLNGGAVSAGTNITVTIPWNDMYQEGDNRVNLYGQNGAGWTPYNQQ